MKKLLRKENKKKMDNVRNMGCNIIFYTLSHLLRTPDPALCASLKITAHASKLKLDN